MHLAACFCRDRGEFVFGEDLVRRLDEDLEILQTKTGKGVVEKCGESGDSLGAGETLREAEVRQIRQRQAPVLGKHADHHFRISPGSLEESLQRPSCLFHPSISFACYPATLLLAPHT